MPRIHTISISDEASLFLKDTVNKSGLIDCLILEYKEKSKVKTPQDLETRKKLLEEEASGKIEILKREIQTIEKTQAEIEAEAFLNEQQEAQDYEKMMEAKERAAVGREIEVKELSALLGFYPTGIQIFEYHKVKHDSNLNEFVIRWKKEGNNVNTNSQT